MAVLEKLRDDIVVSSDLDKINGRLVPDALVGQRIAVYGPRFIWRGLLVAASADVLLVEDVYQVKDCEHDQDTPTNEAFFCPFHVFRIDAISNFGPVKWA